MDNRLDFISAIDQEGIDKMTFIRNIYIELDNKLREIQQVKPLSASGGRTLALARTNLETSLQYAIKTLCLQYEKK
jgi:hypothetical protein